jgi:hypothetical protein
MKRFKWLENWMDPKRCVVKQSDGGQEYSIRHAIEDAKMARSDKKGKGAGHIIT